MALITVNVSKLYREIPVSQGFFSKLFFSHPGNDLTATEVEYALISVASDGSERVVAASALCGKIGTTHKPSNYTLQHRCEIPDGHERFLINWVESFSYTTFEARAYLS
ncbi:hypothetical protein SAMN04487958_107211 [Vreelandella subterranea]|uniref:Uncharacterized protein n=1 Tax=Vreelandella subterranea TaxID=416874 RepID=A0A1H9UTQ6_9GAMM|nr:hypothetical protein [Halomonas subterranea]SES12711.1 hypothetical protein SAMN04487958_107211 [Halomonas subterranea]